LHVTDNATVDGELTVGADSSSNDDFIRFDGGNEFIQWDESDTLIRFSDHIATGGHAQFGSIQPDGVNRFGDGIPQSSESMTGFGDLYLADDLEVTDNLFLGGDLDCDGCIDGSGIKDGDVIKSLTPSSHFSEFSFNGVADTRILTPKENSICFLNTVRFSDGINNDLTEGSCSIGDNGVNWTLTASSVLGDDVITCGARCFTWD